MSDTHTHIPDLAEIMKVLPPLKPGDECYGCHRKVPKIKSDAPTGPRSRSVVSINEPVGEEGTLQNLMIAVVDKYQEQWPMDYAAMRNGIGLELVGGRNWKFQVVSFSLIATLQVPGLEPVTGDEDPG